MESRPESPQEHPVSPVSGTRTSAEGRSAASVELSGQSGAVPDVRLLPAGSPWRKPVVAIRLAENPRFPWHCSNGFAKIDRSDGIVVINVGGYVGSSTKREIAYALDQGKEVRWMFPDAIPAELAEPSRERAA